MLTTVHVPVGVLLLIDPTHQQVRPYCVYWEGRRYKVHKLGFYHSYRKGTRKIHVFSVNVGVLDMRLECDSETFACFLTEVSDGLPD